jgi:tetratricopeptide (TPR) repeat protein
MSIMEDVGRALAFGRHEELRLMQRLPPGQQSARGSAESWSPRDSLIHAAVWKLVFIQAMENPAIAPDEPGPEETDAVNQTVFTGASDLNWEQAEAFLSHAHQRTMQVVQNVPAEALEDVHLFPWLKGQPLWRRLLGSAVLHPVYHYALIYRQLGLPQEALRLQERMLQVLDGVSSHPEWLGVGRYNLACAYALQGERGQALQRLAEALRLRPDLVEWSKQDPDFASLRDDPGYRALYAP